MGKSKGYIRLYREMLEDDFFLDRNHLSVWVYLLLRAQWQPYTIDGVELKPGQIFLKYKEMARDLKMSVQTFKRTIYALKANQCVNLFKLGRRTVITIEKWGTYQLVREAKKEQAEPITEPIEADSRTNSRTNSEFLHLINKNINKNNNKREGLSPVGIYQNVYLTDEEMDRLADEVGPVWVDLCEELSSYMASTGREYENHYATIKRWAAR